MAAQEAPDRVTLLQAMITARELLRHQWEVELFEMNQELYELMGEADYTQWHRNHLSKAVAGAVKR